MNIHEALSELTLAPYLDPPEVADNPWYAAIGIDLWHLCERALDRPINFAFNMGHTPQAYAAYRHDLVVVSGGMFNTLCLIAEAVVEKGAYPHVGAIQDPSWNPQIENHRHTIRKTTVERTFSWSRACNKAWVSDLPRQKLFVYILRLLARFVVLHELGHIWHRHGDREDRRQRFELDGMDDGTTLSPEEATASQARELIADRFAFLQLWSMQEHEQQVEVHDVANFFEHLAPGLLDTKRRRHDFLLQMIYLYFIVMDREDASRDLSRRSHPPAPMRAIALYVDASQGGLLKTTKRTALRRAMTLLSAADALPALLFGRFPNTALLRYQLPDFIRRYSELHPHLATWQRAD